MRIVAAGVITTDAPGTKRAVYTFPALLACRDGTLLLSCRRGSDKDCADEWVELYRSTNGGQSWTRLESEIPPARVGGAVCSLRVLYLTELEAGHLLAASMWIDRESHPGAPLFNPRTEGCLPMGIFLADSFDGGHSFSAWRPLDLPADIGPPSLTNPVIKLPDGALLLSVETNKQYFDASKWFQRVVVLRSYDGGLSWDAPSDAGCDPSGRIFHWDQRVGLAADGGLVSFAWIYDTETGRYCNIRRRLSPDSGRTWTAAQDIGVADQAGRPAMLPDGRVVLAWVDRFGSGSIRARLAAAARADFDPGGEIVIYEQSKNTKQTSGTAATLDDMSIWTYGLPYAEALADGDVMVVYYAGDGRAMDIHYARLSLDISG